MERNAKRTNATKRDLVGRKIVEVIWNRFSDGRGGSASDPTFVLDNGTRICFVVVETESLRYGFRVLRARPATAARGEGQA